MRIITAAALGVLAISLAGCEQLHKETVTFTVESKERRCDSHPSSNGGSSVDCYYAVYGTKGEVFKNRDALVIGQRWKMDSASLQAKLHVGKTYTVRTIGWRLPFLSWSPNIIDIVKEA